MEKLKLKSIEDFVENPKDLMTFSEAEEYDIFWDDIDCYSYVKDKNIFLDRRDVLEYNKWLVSSGNIDDDSRGVYFSDLSKPEPIKEYEEHGFFVKGNSLFCGFDCVIDKESKKDKDWVAFYAEKNSDYRIHNSDIGHEFRFFILAYFHYMNKKRITIETYSDCQPC